jgi:GTP-binding protein HflX
MTLQDIQQDYEQEKAIIVGLMTDSGATAAEIAERSLDELEELADAAGAVVVSRALQHRSAPDSATYLGKGKLEEVARAAQELEASLLIFDDELSGSQIRNVEQLTQMKVVDRTFLILDIFAQRAKSAEGKLQVELAQQQYRLSRLVGLGQSLSRLGGGIGTRGPGESQLESDRRHINRRINTLKQALEEVAARRQQTRQQRQNQDILTLAVVGYTNAGKSTLLNTLCHAELLTMDQLFATLDPAARRLELPDQQPVILIDTVGFIRKLPHHLVDAFRSTLEEVTQADAILHVIDCSDPQAQTQRDVVEQLLNELGAAGKPRLTVLNKIDLVGPFERSGLILLGGKDKFIPISARTREGIQELIEAIGLLAAEQFVPVNLIIPYNKAGWVDRIEQQGKIEQLDYLEDGIHLSARVRVAAFNQLKRDLGQLAQSN